MNLQKYIDSNQLTYDDITAMLKEEFPKVSRSPLSMVKSGTYGVVLAPKAVRILNKAHPIKKHARKKGNSLTVRVDDTLIKVIKRFCIENKMSTQDLLERAIVWYIDGAMTTMQIYKEYFREDAT